MRFGILGPLQLMDGDRSVAVRGSTRRTLLGALLLRPNSPVSSDRLMVDLWGDDLPGDPSGALFQAASRLRKDIAPHLETHPGAYLLRVSPEELDALRFQAVIEEGKNALNEGQADRAGAAFAEALGMWRGPLLADLPELASAEGERTRFEELHRMAMEGRLEAELAAGRHLEMIPELERLVAQEPFGERVWELLMLALYRAGRQQEALATYRRVRNILGGELGIEPGKGLRGLEDRILLQDPTLQPADRAVTHPAGNLTPSRASLVGRRQELAEVSKLVGTNRIVTLTGPGGTGKTRLAIEVGLHVREMFPNGAWLVYLDRMRDPREAPRAVAEVFGLREVLRESPVADLARHLEDRRALLILDNCEHLLEAVTEIAAGLLDRCTGLRVLATSRTQLGLSGEVVYRLDPLTVPEVESHDPVGELLSSEAGQLLLTRGLAVSDGLQISNRWAVAAIELCRRLDGLPLAIELAAARLGALDIGDLLDRLGERLADSRLMASRRSDRHRSLEAALIWSHDLLSETEATLFRRLAVFRGPFRLEAAEGVGGDLPTAEAMTGLVDRSLVEFDPGQRRYRLLQTVRAFAGMRLKEAGEEGEVADHHADFILSLAGQAVPRIQGPDQVSWIEYLEASHDDIRAAHEHLVATSDPRALALVGALWWFWFRHGHVLEGRRFLEEALKAVPEGFDAPRALAWEGVAHMAWFQGDYPEAKRYGAMTLDMGRRLGAEAMETSVLVIPALVARDAEGDLVAASSLLEERLVRARRLGDPWFLATSLSLLATVASASGNRSELIDYSEEAREVYSRNGDTWGLAWSCLLDAHRAILDEAYEEAAAFCREAFGLAIPINHRAGMPLILAAQALADARQGRIERAGVLLGMLSHMETVTGVIVPVPERSFRQTATSFVMDRLGQERATQLHSHGVGLSTAEAYTFVIDDRADP